MFILYLDEVGDETPVRTPLPRDITPYFVIGGVALHAKSWRTIDRELLALKRQILGAELKQWLHQPPKGIAGTPLAREEYFEIKGSDLASPAKSRSRRRMHYLQEALRIIERHNGKVFAWVARKGKTKVWRPNALYTQGLQALVLSLQEFLDEERRDETAMLAIDARKMGQNIIVASSTLSFIFGHEEGRTARRIVEAPFFVRSELSVGVQLADYVCAAIHGLAHIDLDGPLPWEVRPDYNECRILRGILSTITYGPDRSLPLGLGRGVQFKDWWS